MTEQSLPFAVAQRSERYEAAVYACLSDGRWWTAKVLRHSVGVGDRELRSIAERSKGRILGGQHGYRLTRFATVDEVDHTERWLQSQSRKMTHRAVEIRKARNGIQL